MKNKVLSYADVREGYIWNNEKLTFFQIKNISLNFLTDTVTYNGVMGGKDVKISNQKISIYKTEQDAMNDRAVCLSSRSCADCFKKCFGSQSFIEWRNVEENVQEPYMWCFKKSQPILCNVSGVSFVLPVEMKWFDKIKVDSAFPIYKNYEDVLNWNDFVVKEEDGSEHVHKAFFPMLTLTEEQKSLLSTLESTLKALSDSGAELFYFEDKCNLCVLNKKETDDMYAEYCGEGAEDMYDVTDVVQEVSTPIIRYINCESSIFAKEKTNKNE